MSLTSLSLTNSKKNQHQYNLVLIFYFVLSNK